MQGLSLRAISSARSSIKTLLPSNAVRMVRRTTIMGSYKLANVDDNNNNSDIYRMIRQYSTKSKKEETTSDRPKSDANSDKEKKGLFPKSGPLSLPGILLFLTTCMGMVYFYNSEKKRVNEERNKKLSESTAVGKPKLGGPFELIDHNGKEITDKDFLGKYLLVYFGFCHCPDICPDELDKIGEAIEILDKDPKTKDTITPVFITCDPQRDDPATIKQYLEEFHHKIIGLTGSIDQVRKACKAYRVYFSKPPNIKENQDYLVDHSIFSYLMDHNGGFVDIYGKDRTSTEMAESIKKYISEFPPA